jgi:hypothetical protein
MNTIYLSNEAHPLLFDCLRQRGYQCEKILASSALPDGIASHPDLFMCKMGCKPNAPVFWGNPSLPKAPYPYDICYNAACTGTYFIHRLADTNPDLLHLAKEMGMILIDVQQGYTKCNVVVVDETSIITPDKGIYKTILEYPDMNCLLVDSGHVALPGYSTGFLGGASGRVANEIIFHGNLMSHPDYLSMKSFIEDRNLKLVWFEEFPLTDIGSIVELEI